MPLFISGVQLVPKEVDKNEGDALAGGVPLRQQRHRVVTVGKGQEAVLRTQLRYGFPHCLCWA